MSGEGDGGGHGAGEGEGERNPFRIPTIEDIFVLRAASQGAKRGGGGGAAEGRQQPVHMKQTFNSAFSTGRVELQEVQLSGADVRRIQRNQSKVDKLLEFRQKVLRPEKERMSDFIESKRSIFLLQMSMEEKRKEAERLRSEMYQKEGDLRARFQSLTAQIEQVESQMNETEKEAVEQIKRADREAQAKETKQQEIKRLKQEMLRVQSELSSKEEQLMELKEHKDFLTMLTPTAWKEDELARQRSKFFKTEVPDQAAEEDEGQTEEERYAGISCIKFWQENPDYLLEVFTEYEDKSLMLMQRKQSLEETLDRVNSQISAKEAELDKQLADQMLVLQSVESEMEAEFVKRENMVANRQLQSREGGAGQRRTAAFNDRKLIETTQKLQEVYKELGMDGLCDASDVLDMLRTMESYAWKLMDFVHKNIPADILALRARTKQRERNRRQNQLKREEEARMISDRAKKAAERSMKPVVRRPGKPSMPRSKPPTRKKKQRREAVAVNELDEVQRYIAKFIPASAVPQAPAQPSSTSRS